MAPKEQTSLNERRYFNFQEIVGYVEDNYHATKPEPEEEDICVDGRQRTDWSIAHAGASMGFVMSGIATTSRLGLDKVDNYRKKIGDAVVKVVGGIKRFRNHTDSHYIDKVQSGDSPDQACGGCGHFAHGTAEDECGDYKLTLVDAGWLRDFANEAKSHGAPEDKLPGDHKEKAVVLVTSEKNNDGGYWTIYNQAGQKDGQEPDSVFVYHHTLTLERGKRVVDAICAELNLSGQGIQEFEKEFSIVATEQLLTTVGKLASDHPIYRTHFYNDGKSIVVEFDKSQLEGKSQSDQVLLLIQFLNSPIEDLIPRSDTQ